MLEEVGLLFFQKGVSGVVTLLDLVRVEAVVTVPETLPVEEVFLLQFVWG